MNMINALLPYFQHLYDTDYETFRRLMGLLGRTGTLICRRLGVDY